MFSISYEICFRRAIEPDSTVQDLAVGPTECLYRKCVPRNYQTVPCTATVGGKVSYLAPKIKWLDIALGIILSVIGTLAQFHILPLPAAPFSILGGAEVAVGILLLLKEYSKGCIQLCRAGRDHLKENYF